MWQLVSITRHLPQGSSSNMILKYIHDAANKRTPGLTRARGMQIFFAAGNATSQNYKGFQSQCLDRSDKRDSQNKQIMKLKNAWLSRDNGAQTARQAWRHFTFQPINELLATWGGVLTARSLQGVHLSRNFVATDSSEKSSTWNTFHIPFFLHFSLSSFLSFSISFFLFILFLGAGVSDYPKPYKCTYVAWVEQPTSQCVFSWSAYLKSY